VKSKSKIPHHTWSDVVKHPTNVHAELTIGASAVGYADVKVGATHGGARASERLTVALRLYGR